MEGDVLEEETGTCLNETSQKVALRVADVTGGHGPWQFRLWAIYFLASVCSSLHLFSTLPLMSHSSCQCLDNLDKKELSVSQSSSCNNSCTSWDELSDPCFLPMPIDAHRKSEDTSMMCSNAGIVFYAKLVYVLGCFVSMFVIHPLINRFGRRSVSITCCFLLSACSLATSWAIAPASFLVLRFIISICVISMYLIAAVSLMESVTEDFRLLYFYTGHISWGMSHFILPLLIWLINDWLPFNIVLSIFCFILLILVCFFPDSAESYASKGLWARAHKIMGTAARCNGYSVQSLDQFSQNFAVHPEKEDRSRQTFKRDNFQFGIKLLGLFGIAFISSFTYFTSIWLTDWLIYKRGSYFSLVGTTEVASALILLFFSYFIPMWKLWGSALSMSAVCLIIMCSQARDDVPKLSRSLYIAEMFFASASWTVILLKTLSQPLNSKESRYKVLTSGIGIGLGLLLATLADLQKLIGWNRYLLLSMGVPNVLVGVCVGLLPGRYIEV